MRAMVLERNAPISQSPLNLRELPDPVPGDREIRVRIHLCAICRTDLHVIEGELPPRRTPLIPGHQAVGVVDALGPGCKRFEIGDRVGIAWLRTVCGSCPYCRSGRENLCESARFTGYDADGGYAELAVISEDFAYRVPKELSDLSTVPLLCAGIIGYRALNRAQCPPGGTLGIYGFGSSAHIVIQVAKSRGAAVYVITRAPEHRELAKRMGAKWVGDTSAGLPAQLDSAILFAPAGKLIPQALEHLKKGGTLAVAGIHVSAIPSLDYQKHLFFERDLRSVTANTRQDGIELLKEARAHPIEVHAREYPLEAANQALQDLKDDRIQGTGILKVARI